MIETGCFSNKAQLANELLEKIENPNWHIELNEAEGNYSDATIFLQGSCQLFAYALNEYFDYDIVEIRQARGKHYYCQTSINGVTAYIDVRGMTTNWEDFIFGLKYIQIENDYILLEHSSDELKAELKEPGAVFGYDFARHILSNYSHCYRI